MKGSSTFHLMWGCTINNGKVTSPFLHHIWAYFNLSMLEHLLQSFIFTCREFSTCREQFFQLHSNRLSILSLFLLFYLNFFFFSLSSFIFSFSFLPSSDNHHSTKLQTANTTNPGRDRQTTRPRSASPD